MRHFSLLILLLFALSGTVVYGQAAPTSAEDYFNRGAARYGKGDYDGAIADLTKVIELNPRYAAAYVTRGLAKLRQGKDAEAQADIDTALKLNSRLTSWVEEQSAKIKQARQPKEGDGSATPPSVHTKQEPDPTIEKDLDTFKQFLDQDGGYRDRLGGYYNPKAGTYTDKEGGVVDNYGGYTYTDGSYKSGLGDYYDAPTRTVHLSNGEKVKLPPQYTTADAIRVLRENVKDNGGYDKDFIMKGMILSLKKEHPVTGMRSPSSQQELTTLEYNVYYTCNGERVVVTRCRKDSDQPEFPPTAPDKDYCQVYYPDRPRRGGFDASAVELRGDLIKKLQACTRSKRAVP